MLGAGVALQLVHHEGKMPRVPPFLVRSADKLLVSKAIKSFGPQGSYQLPVRKMVFEMSPKAVSHHGLRTYVLHRLGLVQLAKTYPSVEFVVKDSTKTHPLIRSFYGKFLYTDSMWPTRHPLVRRY